MFLLCCCSCGCCRSSAFSSSFCRSRLYPLLLKHVAASTAARFNFSFADGCFNVWSPLSPICPCAIQLTSGERPVYDSTFSSSLSSRSARKTQVRSRKKNSGTEKNTFGSRKKTPCSGKKLFPQWEKNAGKKCRFAAGKIQSSRKNTLQQHKSTFAAEKMHFGGSGKKPSEAGKNPSEARKKPAEAGKKPAAEKVQLCNPKSCRNGKNTFPQREKAAALLGSFSSKQSSHQTKRNNKKLPSTGFKQQPMCNPLATRPNHLQNGFLRRIQFWVRKTFSVAALDAPTWVTHDWQLA